MTGHETNGVLETSVLVLNGHYEPLSVCPVKRALILLILGKAEMVEGSSFWVRSTHRAWEAPSIIRVLRAIRPFRRGAALTKKNVLRRDGHRCQYCGRSRGPMTTDHVIPRSLGGSESWSNLVTACVSCNRRKGNRTPEQAGMTLLRRPPVPRGAGAVVILGTVPDRRWRPYLFRL